MPPSRKIKSVWRIFPLWMWVAFAVSGATAGWFLIPLFFGMIQSVGLWVGWVLH